MTPLSFYLGDFTHKAPIKNVETVAILLAFDMFRRHTYESVSGIAEVKFIDLPTAYQRSGLQEYKNIQNDVGHNIDTHNFGAIGAVSTCV